MANKSQITVDLKINADAQIKNAEKLKKSLEKITNDFSFGGKGDKKLESYILQLESAMKVLSKGTKEGSFINNKDLERIVKAGNLIKEIGNDSSNFFRNKDLSLYTEEVQKLVLQLNDLQKEMEKTTGFAFGSKEQKNYYKNTENTIKALQTQIKEEEKILNNEKELNKYLSEKNKTYANAQETIIKYRKALEDAQKVESKEEKQAIYGQATGRGWSRESTITSGIESAQRDIERIKNTEIENIGKNLVANQEALKIQNQNLANMTTNLENIKNVKKQIAEVKDNSIISGGKEAIQNLSNTTEEINKVDAALNNAAKNSLYLGDAFEGLKNNISYFVSMNFVFDQIVQKIQEAVTTTREMDKDMTQIGLVLGQTAGQAWENFDTYSQSAERLNTTTSQVTNAMKLFYQQGLNTAEVNKMVEASAIAAALGESTLAEASETLTSVINSYNLTAAQAMDVTDKISEVAIASAADFDEISTAIEKVASSAANAGLDLDHLMGYLGKMIETTREAPTNIGTALKTIVANFAQFKEDPTSTTEDGIDVNKVDKALKSVGIQLLDSTGQMRDLGDVIDELGMQWEYLDRNTRSYLATMIAG